MWKFNKRPGRFLDHLRYAANADWYVLVLCRSLLTALLLSYTQDIWKCSAVTFRFFSFAFYTRIQFFSLNLKLTHT